LAVFSNAKNYRRDEHVPLIVPLVNTSHLAVIPHQRAQQSPKLERGFIVTNANCSTTGLVVPLAALEKAFGPLKTVIVTTLQAISGGGYPGVPSLDILDNVVPHIGGEEEKIEWEAAKILGGVNADNTGFTYHAENPLVVSAACNRIAVVDGHTACVSIKFAGAKPSIDDLKRALTEFTCEAQELGKDLVPSAPEQVITVREEEDRPQPRLDRDAHQGAGVSVGRIRDCPVLDYKFVCLVHNTFLGAATSSVINAEVAVAKGVIKV
jgi:aspartate-semialdehyde dehydrogenase